jgi:hypothetical protein
LIEFSTDNGQNWNVVNTVPNSGSYSWLVPAVDSKQCLARVSDAIDPTISDTSDGLFTIALSRYSGGTGEPNAPYRIATPEDLNDIANHINDWTKHFILVNDINLAEYTGAQFKIIGNPSNEFTGVLDGNDHKIWNFTWDSNGINGVGLFGRIGEGSMVKNLGMENVDVNAVNGLWVGGLIGCSREGRVIDCYSRGKVSGGSLVGGLVGYNGMGSIINCYSAGSVWAGDHVGGLVGTAYESSIADCYSTANVDGNDYVGGLVGLNVYYATGAITNSYSTGKVRGASATGGLVGSGDPNSVTASFWDRDTSEQTTSAGGTPKTSAEMKARSTFTNAGWDFVGETINGPNDIWRMCVDGVSYPLLGWEFIPGDITCPDGVGFDDFAVLAEVWHDSPVSASCDIAPPPDGDGVVDILDLAFLAEHWLSGR